MYVSDHSSCVCGDNSVTVIACWTAGQLVKGSILHLGLDPTQDSSSAHYSLYYITGPDSPLIGFRISSFVPHISFVHIVVLETLVLPRKQPQVL